MKKSLTTFLVSVFLFTTLNAQMPTAGLIARYSFNAGVTQDQSGNNLNPSTVNCSPTNDRFGNSNYAMDFNGTSDFIYVPYMNEFFKEEISVCLWFKTTTTSMSRLIALPYSGCPSWSLLYRNPLSTPNGIDFFVGADQPSAYSPYYAGIDVASDDDWHFVVGMRDSINKRIYLYLDCELVDSTSYMGHPYAPNEGLNIGRYNSSYGQYFDGSIDDIRIYNRKLTVAEINLLCDEGNPLSTDDKGSDLTNTIEIYPNPTHEDISVQWGSLVAENHFINVYDMSGKLVVRLPGTSDRINISAIQKGVYLVKISDLEGSIVSITQFVKE